MAILHRQTTGSGSGIRSYEIVTQAPAGAFPARLVDVMETFGVERPSFDDPLTMEVKDVTRLLFAVRDDEGKVHLVQTFEMTLSANEKSALIKLLQSWKGEAPPVDGTYDYCTEIGNVAQVTVAHKTSRKGVTYAFVAGVAPLMAAAADKAPALEEVEIPGGARAEAVETEADASCVTFVKEAMTATTTVTPEASTEAPAEAADGEKDPF